MFDDQMSTAVVTGIVGIVGVVGFYLWRQSKKPKPKPFTINPLPKNIMDDDPMPQSDSFVEKMKSSKKQMVVFYGSQTGTAEGFAYRLAKDARRYGIGAMVVDPEGCPFDSLSELSSVENNIVVFCVATYGEGDPTDNAQELFEWLQHAPDSGVDLKGINFAVFGLGNKTYENYNTVGKCTDKQMEELHASRICELGMGDDDANIEDDFIIWSEKFWASVCYKFNITRSSDDPDKGSRQYKLTEYDQREDKPPLDNLFTGEPARLRSYTAQKPPFDAKNPFLATVLAKRELHKSGERSCIHIEIDISGSRMRYDAGDHLAIIPENSSELVEKIGKRLNVDLEKAFTLENVDPEATKRHPFPCPTTYKTALTHYLDITSPPRTHVLRELAEFTSDEGEKAKLNRMSSPSDEGRKEYADWILNCRRDLLAVLEDLPNLQPPIDLICELLPRLQPRYYSISSSPKLHPTAVHITAVVVEYKSNANRINKGVCTNFLKDKPVGEKVPVFIRRSQFRLPFRPSVPVIMVGPGTGVAPFRGFIQDRHYAKNEGKPVGDTVLFFGCRKRDEDYLYEEELQEWYENGTLTKLHVAFSRDTAKKIYVQNMIRENAKHVWELVHTNRAHIYVCGDARKMAPDVYATLIDICVEHGSMTKSDAIDYMKRMSKQGRYSADVWS